MTESPYRRPEALELPFDQYQRYATAVRIVESLGGWKGRRILDVGGAPGFLELFFDNTEVAVVDRYGTHGGNFIVADGAKLPFADNAFDIVVSLDTLEHVPAQFRPAFLSECQRVAGDIVVLSAPHATDGVVLAEKALQAFVTARFGEVFGTLQEHSDNGLPVLEETLAALGANGWHAARLPSGYLPRWLMGMVMHHELLAVGLPHLPELHRFYNEQQSLQDNADPSYRQVFVASGTRTQAELDGVVASLRSPAQSLTADATLAAIAGSVLSARLNGVGVQSELRNELAALREELAVDRTVVADRDAHLGDERGRNLELTARISELEAEIEEMRTAPGPARRVANRGAQVLAGLKRKARA